MKKGIKNTEKLLVMIHYFPWQLSLQLGRMRRKSGKYDKTTYACFHHSWIKNPSLANLLAYLSFRRDLGLILPRRFRERLQRALPSASRRQQHTIINLLVEAAPSSIFTSSCSSIIEKFVDQSPAAAAYTKKNSDAGMIEEKPLAVLQNEQEKWREELTNYIRGNKHGTCVVGNSAKMERQGRGQNIDRHDVVIRFNQYAPANIRADLNSCKLQHVVDAGDKINIWVRSPGFNGSAPTTSRFADWIILTGPDVRYQLFNWKSLDGFMLKKQKVITVPLGVWRKLVKELEAPPSAGVLVLTWLNEILGCEHCISIAGFQTQGSEESRYHRLLPHHKASKRHNWKGEAGMLQLWLESGEIALV